MIHSVADDEEELDAGTRAQVAEFLRMTPAERLRSLVNTVTFIQRARLRAPPPAEPASSGR
jgi:hypothetical protein